MLQKITILNSVTRKGLTRNNIHCWLHAICGGKHYFWIYQIIKCSNNVSRMAASGLEQEGAIKCSIVHSSAWDAAPACSSLTVLVTSGGRSALNVQILSSVHTTRFLSQGRLRIGYCDWHIITPISPRPPLIRGVKLPTHGKAMCDYQKKIGHQSQRESSDSALVVLALYGYLLLMLIHLIETSSTH